MDKLILCIHLAYLNATSIIIPEVGQRIMSSLIGVDLNRIFMDFYPRDVKDSKNIFEFKGAIATPQVLPYIVVKHKGKVLTYSRSKGAETRLHGSRSIGFGGHIDKEDYNPELSNMHTIYQAAKRELKEELGLVLDNFEERVKFTHNILDYTNSVGMVHFGLVAIVELSDFEMDSLLIDPEEITDAVFQEIDALKTYSSYYENWSQMIIEELI